MKKIAASLLDFYTRFLTRTKVVARKHLFSENAPLVKLWHQQSGDWHWLAEKKMPIASINRHLWRLSVPSLSFFFLLGLSGIISTLGLLADSVAVIIGAMIIAPLMGPIIGVAYAMVVGNRRLLRRSSLTLFTGVMLTIAISFLTMLCVGLQVVGSEVLSRTNPTLIDLGVALAAGAAGSFANSRRRIADALPGVAISVALVPPLSVIGIGLALGEQQITIGSLLLFLTNLAGIIFSGSIVFLLQRYGSLEKAKRGLVASFLFLFLLGLPLGLSLKNLLVQENVRRNVSELIRRRTLTFADRDIRSVRVQAQGDQLFVELEVAAPFGSISEHQIDLVRDFISDELQQDVKLIVRMIPVDVFVAPFE
ncbi:TIGR00341 family protein [Lusitaniella coriacea LEGE 07157]|uniref:TIGR00341 family protein n=1 Tax=Lusitaniella coriacea LEGE 07157 TaxID=945747 RepID=A0A8J7E0J7_9CYAN|nr:TIGR00341 family protein [Lusitaniella coriacea]MBE9118820.1 TIGR00341 family protein [Lusitaniella coriacea LEGE 07157]